jgi:hypothetical protein
MHANRGKLPPACLQLVRTLSRDLSWYCDANVKMSFLFCQIIPPLISFCSCCSIHLLCEYFFLLLLCMLFLLLLCFSSALPPSASSPPPLLLLLLYLLCCCSSSAPPLHAFPVLILHFCPLYLLFCSYTFSAAAPPHLTLFFSCSFTSAGSAPTLPPILLLHILCCSFPSSAPSHLILFCSCSSTSASSVPPLLLLHLLGCCSSCSSTSACSAPTLAPFLLLHLLCYCSSSSAPFTLILLCSCSSTSASSAPTIPPVLLLHLLLLCSLSSGPALLQLLHLCFYGSSAFQYLRSYTLMSSLIKLLNLSLTQAGRHLPQRDKNIGRVEQLELFINFTHRLQVTGEKSILELSKNQEWNRFGHVPYSVIF